ncbi:MAG: hypothetical protein JWM44_3054 [Bacilli bacterium]|nr:hypothetical protein [Bacilli bacterium]
MGSISGIMTYDFKSTRDQIEKYKWQYILAKLARNDELIGVFMTLIDELECEIAKAHQTVNTKISTGQGGHAVMQFRNLSIPSISQWNPNDKESEAILSH